MKHWSLLTIILVLVVLGHPTPVGAEVFRFKGESAYAIFSTTDGCVVTHVVVSATEGTTHAPPEPKDSLSSAFLTIFRWNVCTYEQLLDIAGDTYLDAQGFNGNQQAARLRGVIDVYDRVSQSFFDVFVDLQWTGTGELTRERSHTHDAEGCILNSLIMGTSRPAQATGSVSVHGTNVTPAPSVEARVITANEVTVTFNCPEPG